MQFRNRIEEIRRISSQYGIALRKNQGQCFLINEQIADYIIEQAELDASRDVVLEIGPGFGILTQKLLERSKNTIAIEIDHKITQYLRNVKFSNQDTVQFITKDALKTSFPSHSRLVSNVPYQISGPLIQKIIISEEKADLIILMLQEEFILRMNAPPQAKGYGRLSVLSQLFFHMELLRKVPKIDFYPQPEVQSGIIKLKFNPKFMQHPNIPQFIEFLAGIFPYKNKIIPKALNFLIHNLEIFSNLDFLRNLELNRVIEVGLKNKRVWQLTPLEIWNFFNSLLTYMQSDN